MPDRHVESQQISEVMGGQGGSTLVPALSRDRSRLRVWNGPGSAAHHHQAAYGRRLRRRCASANGARALRAALRPGHTPRLPSPRLRRGSLSTRSERAPPRPTHNEGYLRSLFSLMIFGFVCAKMDAAGSPLCRADRHRAQRRSIWPRPIADRPPAELEASSPRVSAAVTSLQFPCLTSGVHSRPGSLKIQAGNRKTALTGAVPRHLIHPPPLVNNNENTSDLGCRKDVLSRRRTVGPGSYRQPRLS